MKIQCSELMFKDGFLHVCAWCFPDMLALKQEFPNAKITSGMCLFHAWLMMLEMLTEKAYAGAAG